MSKRSFVPNCVTSDGTTFYAHATFSLGSGNTGRTIVIAKSNTNPASFSDVTWSIYATVSEADMGTYLQGMNILKAMLCSVDSQGVFTIISTSTKTSINSPETLGMGGYQYTPHADPTTGGTWTTILMKDPYPWSSLRSGGLVSVPAGTAGGKDVLMHVFQTSSSEDSISVGVFDPFTKSFSLQSNWTLPSPGHPYIIEPRGGQMHVLTYAGTPAVLNRMSISPTAVQPANASIATSNFTIPDGCNAIIADRPQTLLFANTFYYMCHHSSNANYLVTTNGTDTVGPLKTTVFGSYNDLYPIGPPEGPPRWAMMTNYSDYAGVVLSGDKIGEFQTASTGMILTGLPGDGDVSSDGDSGGGGSGGGGSGMSSGMVAGIVAGAILLIVSMTSICRLCTKRSKRHLGFSRPTTPVYEDPDSLVPNIADVPEAKMECEALPMAPTSAMPPVPLGTTGTGTGVGLGKDAGSSVLPPPLLAPRPLMDTKVSQTAQAQQPPSSQSPQTLNTYEDGYQQGFQQALLALREEQEQQQRQQEQQRRAQNPQLLTTTLAHSNLPSVPTPWSPANSDTTTVTSNNPQYYSQGNSPQYYPLPASESIANQQQQQQRQQGYYQIGVTADDPRNPQSYNSGAPLSPVAPGSTPLSPLPAYVSGSVSMSPVPSYVTGSVGTPYTPPSGTSQAWTPGSTACTPPVVPGSNHYPGNQGRNPSYRQ
ncbi:hypothetical protein EC957_000180 [Mortierella hygrophila]|uniref:Uncharacterized protein n=1 Tax=Mortierella hygrophila TaxID=979708 RepID=A0A9P6FGR2_9FUNG|nr:hypothetical protein EC957_000180 [Mortierella hygrophila]